MSTVDLLTNIPVGRRVKLSKIKANTDLICRLCELGLTTDASVTILSNTNNCPLVVKCRQSQLMISRELSQFIEVIDPLG